MKYIGLVLLVMICCGFAFPGCATLKGNVTLQINEAGNIYQADYWSKGGIVDFKIKGDSLEVQAREASKPNFGQKVVAEAYGVVKDAVAVNRSAKIAKEADITQ